MYNAALAANNGNVLAGVINPDDIEKPHGRYVVRIKVDGVEKEVFHDIQGNVPNIGTNP